MSAYNDLCVARVGNNAEVWDILNGEHLHTIEIEKEFIRRVAISDEFIVVDGWDSTSYNLHLYIYGIRDGYKLKRKVFSGGFTVNLKNKPEESLRYSLRNKN